jgi:hypothetical protein
MEIIKDIPIDGSLDSDLFNFKFYANKVQEIIQSTEVFDESLSIGIYGKWGEGKTSFLNLLESGIDLFSKSKGEKGIMKFHFNPWRYSTEQEILFDFYEGLSNRLSISNDVKLQSAGKFIKKYGRYLKAVKLSASIGMPGVADSKISFEPYEILKTLGEDFEGSPATLTDIKLNIDKALETSGFKIVVFIDDVDRLDKDEIYTILKLIKLNANFKNLVYLITMDDEQVAKAINHRYGIGIEDGRLFLDKIINIPIALPKIEEADLKRFFKINLLSITKNLGYESNEYKKEELNEILLEFRPNLFKSPREIIKVLNSFFFTAFAIGDEINLRDLFWMEYLKIKQPGCYRLIKNYHPNDPFTALEQQITFNDQYTSDVDGSLNGLRKEISENYPEATSFVSKLFPLKGISLSRANKSPEQFNKELRINHVNHFDKYFSYHIQGKLSEILMEKFLTAVKSNIWDDANKMLGHFFKSYELHKVVYRLLNQIESFKDIDDRNLFFKYIFNFRNIIPQEGGDMFGKNSRLELIEGIGKELNTNNPNLNEAISLQLAEILDYSELCYYIRQFKYQNYETKLKTLLIEKVKGLNSHPFYLDSKNPVNKMVMSVWLDLQEQEFKDYLEANTTSMEITGKLIQNFPTFWNNTFFGALSLDNFHYMHELLDIKWLYHKVEKFYPKAVSSEIKPFDFNGKNSMSMDDSVKQFIYHYQRNQHLIT